MATNNKLLCPPHHSSPLPHVLPVPSLPLLRPHPHLPPRPTGHSFAAAFARRRLFFFRPSSSSLPGGLGDKAKAKQPARAGEVEREKKKSSATNRTTSLASLSLSSTIPFFSLSLSPLVVLRPSPHSSPPATSCPTTPTPSTPTPPPPVFSLVVATSKCYGATTSSRPWYYRADESRLPRRPRGRLKLARRVAAAGELLGLRRLLPTGWRAGGSAL